MQAQVQVEHGHVGNVAPPTLKLHAGNDLQPGGPATYRPAYRTIDENPELAQLVEAWPGLPDLIKAAIVAMIRAASGPSKP